METAENRLPGGMANRRETNVLRRKKGNPGVHNKAPPLRALTTSHKVTVDTGVYVTVARPDIAAEWPDRQPNQRHTLQTASGEVLTILMEVIPTLILGWRPIKM
jgi:hypothetical protein